MATYGDALLLFGEWLNKSEGVHKFNDFVEDFADFFEEVADLSYTECLERMDPLYLPALASAMLEGHLSAYRSDHLIDLFTDETGSVADAGQLAYLRAVRRSQWSVYEVLESAPGSHMVLRDMFRPGDPIRVREKTASQTVGRWELLLTRVISVKRVRQITSGTVPISRASIGFIQKIFKMEMREGKRNLPKWVKADPRSLAEVLDDAVFLAGRYALASWILAASPNPSARPQLVNMDGEDIEFVSMAYPVNGNSAFVEKALQDASDFEPAEQASWNWLQLSQGSQFVHASLRLEGDRLLAECNSGERAERLTERLAQILGRQVGQPLRMEASFDREMSLSSAATPSLMETLGPKEQEQVRAQISQLMLEQYRQTLDHVVPILEGTPRELVKTKAGKEAVANWLKFLELSQSRGEPHLDYGIDFTLLWKELGILKLRV